VNEQVFQIALTRIKGLGPIRQKRLLDHFIDASGIFNASSNALREPEGIGELAFRAIESFKGFTAIEKELELLSDKNIETHFYTDESYPNRLRFCVDAPILLYTVGKMDFNKQRFVGIVGTRKASNYGKRMVRKLLEELSSLNITLVSGLAYGIDINAHRTALDYDMQNIAVLAHGLQRVYPTEHRECLKQMAANGGAITEYPYGVIPNRENFPERNRIIAGLCDALVLVESKKKGGAMITAELADSYNRDVFAVPGKTEDTLSRGCNFLIKRQKAHMLEDPQDLIRQMNWIPSSKKKKVQKQLFVPMGKNEEKIVSFLSEQGTSHLEEIAQGIKLNSTQIALHLLELEINGVIRSMPGSIYALC